MIVRLRSSARLWTAVAAGGGWEANANAMNDWTNGQNHFKLKGGNVGIKQCVLFTVEEISNGNGQAGLWSVFTVCCFLYCMSK